MPDAVPPLPKSATIGMRDAASWWQSFREILVRDWMDLGAWIRLTRDVAVPAENQSLLASSSINPLDGCALVTSAAPVTISATPSVLAGREGQVLRVCNAGSFAITLQDESALSGSKLSLNASTLVLQPGAGATFLFLPSGLWVRV